MVPEWIQILQMSCDKPINRFESAEFCNKFARFWHQICTISTSSARSFAAERDADSIEYIMFVVNAAQRRIAERMRFFVRAARAKIATNCAINSHDFACFMLAVKAAQRRPSMYIFLCAQRVKIADMLQRLLVRFWQKKLNGHIMVILVRANV